MARPRTHVVSSLPLAYLVKQRWGWFGVLGTMAAGVLIDGDHLVDYAWTRARGEKSHFLAPLHGWEVAAGLSFLSARVRRHAAREAVPGRWLGHRARRWDVGHVAALLTGATVGIWLHLILDVIGNRPRHLAVYSLVYRARHGFRREKTGWSEKTGFHFWSELPWHRWWTAF